MDARKIWQNFAAKQFANSIATKSPKISFPNNKILQHEWEWLEKNNNFLKINYKLVNNSSINTVCFLGLKEINGTPLLFVGESKSYRIFANKLIELCVLVDEFKGWQIFETYDLNENNELKNVVFRHCMRNGVVTNFNNIGYNLPIFSFLKSKNIPYTPFFSNPLENNDLDNISQEIFDNWRDNIFILMTDSLVSKGIIHLNTPQMSGSIENFQNLKNALLDPKKVLYENKNIFSMLQQGGVQIQQGVSNFLSILQKIEFFENRIKQFGFLKKDTSDLGTKNLQKSETELLNSDSDDYIELKANLMELQWENFIRNVFFDYLKEIKGINTDYKNALIEVEICGSTKYLQNYDNKYVQNQQGVLTNPNDLNSNKNHLINNNNFVNKENLKK